MPGVALPEGTSLRIPAGALQIPLDGSDPPAVRVLLALDTWPHWLRGAIARTMAAHAAHKAFLEGVRSTGTINERTSEPLAWELTESMQAITASAFAVDSFYASTKERFAVSPQIQATWRANRTARSSQIAEVLRQAFQMSAVTVKEARRQIQVLFRFRDWAAHPPADFREPIKHPDIDVAVEWRFVAFSAVNALNASSFAIALVRECLRNPQGANSDLCAWAAPSLETAERIATDAKEAFSSNA